MLQYFPDFNFLIEGRIFLSTNQTSDNVRGCHQTNCLLGEIPPSDVTKPIPVTERHSVLRSHGTTAQHLHVAGRVLAVCSTLSKAALMPEMHLNNTVFIDQAPLCRKPTAISDQAALSINTETLNSSDI